MDYYLVTKRTIFRNMTDKEIDEAVSALRTDEIAYEKGDMILASGSVTSSMGLVLSGTVIIECRDYLGNLITTKNLKEGTYFAESQAFLQNEPVMADVIAGEDCRILFLRLGDLHDLHRYTRSWTPKLLLNLMFLGAQKQIFLAEQITHTLPKTIRSRVMAYLLSVSEKEGSTVVDIPMDRQEMADYLRVERTALSKELGRMQKDGLIRMQKNHFELLVEMPQKTEI